MSFSDSKGCLAFYIKFMKLTPIAFFTVRVKLEGAAACERRPNTAFVFAWGFVYFKTAL